MKTDIAEQLNSHELRRREFLDLSRQVLLGAAALSIAPLSLTASDIGSLALAQLGEEEVLILAQVSRLLFPHDALAQEVYLDVVRDIDADMSKVNAKGGAIALMVDLMCGPLIGEVSSPEAGAEDNGDGGPATGGELILAFDPTHFGGPEAIERGEQLFNDLLSMDGTRLPGARRLAARQKTPEEGIEIPATLHQTILDLIG